MRGLPRGLFLLLLVTAPILAGPLPGLAQGAGVLEGKVVNGSAGGPQVASGLPITLHVFRDDVEESSLQAKTDSQGGFRFEGLDTDPALQYVPEATYLGVTYASTDGYQFGVDQSVLNAALTVFETTSDDSPIRLDSVHMIAESFGGVLRLSEVHVFANDGDRTFIGKAEAIAEGQRTTVVIPLPQDAVGLAFPEGKSADRYVESEGSLHDTQPVRPGADASVVRFSYHLVVDGPSETVSREFAYPVSTLTVLAVEPGLTVYSDKLGAADTVTFQDQQYGLYQVQGLDPSTPLVLEFVPSQGGTAQGVSATVSGGPTSSGEPVPSGSQGVIRWLGLGLVALAVAGGLAYPLLKRPTRG